MVVSMQQVKCANCGTVFPKLTKAIKQQKTSYHFCTTECFYDFQKKNPYIFIPNTKWKTHPRTIICESCGKEFHPVTGNQKYCSECEKKVRRERGSIWARKDRSKQRYKELIKNKNKSSYGKNKTILLNYRWTTIVYSHKNYMVVKKLEDDNSRDIWDVIKDSVKRGRVTYYNSLEGALNDFFNHSLLSYIGHKKYYGATIYDLKKAIFDVKKEILKVFSQQCADVSGSLRQTDSEIESRGS